MKCHPVNNLIYTIILSGSVLASFHASAQIENTVIADYNFATGESTHRTVIVDSNDKQSVMTLIPLDEKDTTPSIFRITACFNRRAGQSTHGELHFTAIDINKSDTKMVNLGDFVEEHNLAVWWTPLSNHLLLIHNIDPSAIVIINPAAFITHAPKCHTH